MSNNVTFSTDSNFRNEKVSSLNTSGNDNIVILQDNHKEPPVSFRTTEKPNLTKSSNAIHIEKGERVNVKVKPNLTNRSHSKKVPVENLQFLANPRKNNGGNTTDEDSSDNEEEDDEVMSNISLNNEEDDSDDEEETVNIGEHRRMGEMNDSDSEEDDDSDAESDADHSDGDHSDVDSEDEKDSKPMSYEEIQRDKQDLLCKLDRFAKNGYRTTRKYSMASNYDDIKFEYQRIKKQRDIEKSIKFSRKILMGLISGVEYLNGKFDPLDVKLDGWSEHSMENIEDYDEVFEELHEKYSESVSMAPELKLIMMVSGSAFMYHLTNTLFKSASPNIQDILKQNPDIMASISKAAMGNMTSQMGAGPNDPIASMMQGGLNMNLNKRNQAPRQQFGPGRSPPPSSSRPVNKQYEMAGPSGVDDILNELNSNAGSDVGSESGRVRNVNISARSRRKRRTGKSLNL